MEEMEVVKDRTVGSRFALSYNQHTTKNCLELRHCTESEYGNHYHKSMNEVERNGRTHLNSDSVFEEQSKLIVLGLSSDK